MSHTVFLAGDDLLFQLLVCRPILFHLDIVVSVIAGLDL